MFKISENASVNYLAKIVKLGTPIKHENANALQGFIIDHNRTWTNMDYSEGDIVVYFPLECCINPELLSYLNLYQHADLNADKTKKSYFSDSGRVKAIRLRGEPSEGIVLPVIDVLSWIENKTGVGIENYKEQDLNTEFDSFNNTWICKKYIPKNSKVQGSGNKSQAKKKQIDLIVEGQFRFHYDTLKLVSQLHEFKPEDVIVITRKKHGSSHISSNLLVKKELCWFEKILNYLGINIKTEEYQNVYSSRKVIKAVGETNLANEGFYDEDIWKAANNILKPLLINGQTIYCELYGYQPNSSKFIQNGYDYGNAVGSMNLDVYRITTTSPEGTVHEWDWESVKQWCNKYGVNHVEELYYGTAQLFTPLNPGETNEQWQEHFLEDIKTEFLEKDAWDCKNNVPDEGVCIMNLNNRVWRKYKSFKFLQFESSELDKGVENIEDNI